MSQSSAPRVSVIIPSYNHEKFVAECIQSVLHQTCQDFEIVITDDGSHDGTVAVIRQFKDPRVRLFCFPENRGACVAANHCVEEARGEYVAMLSSDDVFLPDKLSRQVAFLDEHPGVGAVLGYPLLVDEEGKEFGGANEFRQPNRSRCEWLNHFFFRGNCLCHPTALIRRKCYRDVGSYDLRFAQLPDFDFWIRLCLQWDLHILPENLIKFRLSRNQANASAGTVVNRLRGAFEKWKIFSHYTSPFVRKHAEEIFPKFNSFPLPFKTDSFEVRLAYLALQQDSEPHKLFALELLLEQQRVENLSSREFNNVLAATGKADLAGLFAGSATSLLPSRVQRLVKSSLSPKLRRSLRKRLIKLESGLHD